VTFPRLLFDQHSLYVGVVETCTSPTIHRGAVQKDGHFLAADALYIYHGNQKCAYTHFI